MADEKKDELSAKNELDEISKVLGELDLDSNLSLGAAAPAGDKFVSVSGAKAPPVVKEPPKKAPPVPEKPPEPKVKKPKPAEPSVSFLDEIDKVHSGETLPDTPTSFFSNVKIEEPPAEEVPAPPPAEELPAMPEEPPPLPVEEPPVEEIPAPPPAEELPAMPEEPLPFPVEEPPVITEELIPTAKPVQKGKKELSDAEILAIHKKISVLKPQLRRIVKRIIINDELRPGDMNTLMDYLLVDQPEEVIQSFVEQSLNILIEKKGPPKKHRPAVRRKLKPSVIDIIKHDFFPIVRLAVPVLGILILVSWFVIAPAIKKNTAKGLIKDGVRLINKDNPLSFEKAEKKFNEALEINKDYPEAYIKYGEAYLNINKYDRAEKKYRDLLNEDDSNVDAYFGLGDLYQKQLDYQKALKEYENILKFKKNNISALDRIARLYYYKMDDKNSALDIYKKIIERDEKNLKAHYGLLSIYIWEKDLDNVEKEHYQVLLNETKENKKDKQRLTELAEFYIDYDAGSIAKNDDLQNKAEDTINRILDTDKKYPEAYFQKARLSRKRRDLANSELSINNALKYKKKSKYYNFLGEIYLQQNKLNRAIESFQEGLGAEEEDPEVSAEIKAKINYNLGNINYYDLGNYGEALNNYNAAVEKLGDKYYDLNYNLGWLYYQNGFELDKAAQFFNKAKEISKQNDPLISFALGNTYIKLGKYDEAIAEYLDVTDFFKEKYGEYPAVNPANKELVEAVKLLSATYNNLGVCKVKNNDEKKALVFFWKAVESAKKLGFSNENAEARANIQYVLQSQKVVKESQMYNMLRKDIINEPYEHIPF